MADDQGPWTQYQKARPDAAQPSGPWQRYGQAQPQTKQAEQPDTSQLSAIFRSFLHGAEMTGRGLVQAGESMPSLFAGGEGRRKLLADTEAGMRQSEEAYQKDPAIKAHPYLATGGRIAGEVAPGLAAGAAGPAARAVGMLPRVAGAAPSLAARIGGGAAAGAAGAMPAPVTPPQGQPAGQPQPAANYWGEKGKQLLAGLGIGGAIPGAGGALAPRLPSPELVQQGISRAFRPLRNFVMGSEERTIDGFDRTIARQVLEPIGGDVPRNLRAGHGLVEHTENAISDVYNRTLPQVSLPRAAAEAPNQDLTKTVSELGTDELTRYQTIIQNRLWSRFPPNGVMDGQTFQNVRSDLSGRAVGFLGTNNNELGHALLETVSHLDEAVAKTNEKLAPDLRKANAAWRMFVRMRQAAGGATSRGKFSPEDLLRAVRRQERSPGAFATGDAPLQGYAEVGLSALGKRSSPMELLHIFSKHGLPVEISRQFAGPIGRGMKAATPIASPIAGRMGADAQPQQKPPTPADRVKAVGKVSQLQTDLYNAKRSGNLEETRDLMRQLADAQNEYRQIAPRTRFA